MCAVTGYDVFLLDISQDAVDRGMSTLRKNLDRQVAKQTLTQQIADDAYPRIGQRLSVHSNSINL
ncbi:3-hydroxyacyl-CoA dehydrogenase NAD-binding domain-containing protein [Pseudomonas sp. NFX224]|uniref:3-hydroxyacyl-CoA dehydrogenase NAD-binding domain-containing protein n=1 Tax=Pseudomonas sp. NFX224 TaxID=3402862 RepID=UPI003AFA8E27